MSIDYCVICDECGIVLSASRHNAKKAREDAANSAFRAVNRSSQDFCRSCHVGRVGSDRYDRRMAEADAKLKAPPAQPENDQCQD